MTSHSIDDHWPVHGSLVDRADQWRDEIDLCVTCSSSKSSTVGRAAQRAAGRLPKGLTSTASSLDPEGDGRE